MVKVEVVYLPKDKPAFHKSIEVAVGACVQDVLNQSGLGALYPETDELPVGIFAKKVSRERVVKPGERIEIYRTLLLDPKEKRRQRAANN